ncbi:MAG: hypothetical protein J0I06_26780 [Planctomycetes bacterium]|nr:hypothetical protein [Planctomycetota bacterium]
MPKAPPFNPLRLVSPAQLVFCFVLFFLPWIEMTCTMPPSAVKTVPKEEIDKVKKELGFDPTKPVSMISQSGLQIATGGSSLGSDMKKIESKMKESGLGDPDKSKEKPKKDDDIKGAPLLFVYPLALLAGTVAAFLPVPGMIRRIVVAACCAAALGVVGLQALIGFPMENEIKKKSEEMKGVSGGGLFGPMGGAPPGDKTGGKKDAKSEKMEDVVRVSWQFSLYLTFLFLLGAAGTAFLDGLGGDGGKSRYGRKNRRDDYDEDDYDDEDDDRPRKKSRRDDYEDEDDRPRKKKPAEPEFEMPAPAPAPPPTPATHAAPGGPNPFDFSEEPAPKKKPRRRDDEDDEDDDRPRKKRRRDDD